MVFKAPEPHDFKKNRSLARQRSRENRQKVLLWTLKTGRVTERNLQQLLGLKRRQSYTLIKQGVLEKNVSSTGRQVAFTLNHEVLMEAYEIYEEFDSAEIALTYPWPQTPIPFAKLGAHQEYAQAVAMRELFTKGGVLRVDRELRYSLQGAIPDFAISRGSETDWHEIELNSKYAERLYFQMQAREMARQEGRFSRLVWWCKGEPVAKVIRGVLGSKVIPKVLRRADGKIVRIPGVEGWNPKRLASVSDIRILGKNGDYSSLSSACVEPQNLESEIDVSFL
jgi:hypothetical protein